MNLDRKNNIPNIELEYREIDDKYGRIFFGELI